MLVVEHGRELGWHVAEKRDRVDLISNPAHQRLADCQSASKSDPRSASKIDPP
jgi:hypothetical protein